MVGTWTGGVGPYLYTIKVNNDGNGYFCYSWNKINSDGKLVYDGSNLITQNGEKLKVNNIDNGQLNISASYYMVTEKYKFYKDQNTEKSSTYCQEFYQKII